MPVIKEFEPRIKDIQTLETLVKETTHNKTLNKRILSDLKKMRIGEKAERNASYLLGELFKTRQRSFLINSLRLEIDNDVAQIDHLGINSLGIVYLFETKNFSTGIKIDSDGTFWRWNAFNKNYVEIPSPIRQSTRHERLVKLALEKVGFKVEHIEHFVIVDYNAKLIKPKTGFENVCRPDRVEDAIDNAIDRISPLKVLSIGSKALFRQKSSIKETEWYAKKLAQMHSPKPIDFRSYYAIDQVETPPSQPERITDEPPQNVEPQFTKVTLAAFAKSKGVKTKQLELQLITAEFLETRNDKTYLSQKGKDFGIEVKKGRYGFYFIIPEDFNINL